MNKYAFYILLDLLLLMMGIWVLSHDMLTGFWLFDWATYVTVVTSPGFIVYDLIQWRKRRKEIRPWS